MFSRVAQVMRLLGEHLLTFLTARSVVVISTTCAILYALFWGVGLLQVNGLISTALPIPVADAVILRRSGAQLSPAAVGANEKAVRDQALAQAQTASDSPNADTSSPITLEIQTGPPVDLWVSDDHDNGVGTNPETGLVRLQIPGAAYSGKGTDPQLVSIPHGSGTYRIQLLGHGLGHFDIRVRAFVGGNVNDATVFAGSGDVFPDTLLQSEASVSLSDDGKPNLVVGSVRVVLAGDVPSPSPSPTPSASPASSPESAPPDSQVAAAEVQGPVAVAQAAPVFVPPPAPNNGPPRVFRPQPPPTLPGAIPLPVPVLPAEAPASEA
ncbi:MAG: hypothetical protein ACR2IK_21535 [Chloroflexota bacterium]